MWKKIVFILWSVSNYVIAEPQVTTISPPWLEMQKQREVERENFLQLENLLNMAIREKRVNEQILSLAEQLKSPNYPLQEEADWLILKAKLTQVSAQNLAEIVQAIAQFRLKYPNTAKRHQIEQLPISLYFQHEKLDELLGYIQHTPAVGLVRQCQALNAKDKWLQRTQNSVMVEHEKLLEEFGTLWQTAMTALPKECEPLEVSWREKGYQTVEKTKQKAVARFIQNQTLTDIHYADEALNKWLQEVELLRINPQNLPSFAQNQPLEFHNSAIVYKAFSAWIKTQPEQIGQQEFNVYQEWAEKFQLNKEEWRQWQILFFNRAFDNEDKAFQTWRDKQLRVLNADNLIERRLRLAIWQKTELGSWLALLSSEAKEKQEWRYWKAKIEPEQKRALLAALSQERGFYALLAAQELGERYQVKWQNTRVLSDSEQVAFQPTLDRIAELRYLKRFEQAKLVWTELLQAVDFSQKLALSDYALKQAWYDLTVEGTILAKAWDYIPLRLPNAYAEWFKLHLQQKNIRQSFAMAIARQESAWNFQARSHANALGLMQMLPATAKQTAENSGLPFRGESDLLQPFYNIMLGTAHLEELNQKYPNNRILIAAAYNAGRHRVERWLKRANGRLAMDEFIASIPFVETRGYVQNVLAYDYYYQLLYSLAPSVMFTKEELKGY